MSGKAKARRTKVEVAFNGTDITSTIQPYFLSLTYTDNEEDVADDLQIKVHDRGNAWVGEWIGEMVNAAAVPDPIAEAEAIEAAEEATAEDYVVTVNTFLNIRSGPSTDDSILGTLSNGDIVRVYSIENNWAKIKHKDGKAYVYAGYIKNENANAAAEASETVTGGRVVKAKYTAYYPANNAMEGGFYDALGHLLDPSEHTCAAPKSVPFGTKITIQGTGTSRDGQTYTVTDRGGAINIEGDVYHFDILMSSNSECNNWGVRYGTAIIGGTAVSNTSSSGSGASAYSAKSWDGGGTDAYTPPASTTDTKPEPVVVGADEIQGSLRIQAAIVRENWQSDGRDDMLDCGEFDLDSVTASGPPSVVTIKATSVPYREALRDAVKSRVWQNLTLSGIAKEIASANKMLCMFESANDPFFERKEQFKTSDIEFLSGLCHDAGISLKATNQILVLFDQEAYENKDAVVTIKRNGGTYVDYRLGTGKASCAYNSCRVAYTDPKSGSVIEGYAYAADYDSAKESNQQLEITTKVKDRGEAEALAKKQLRLFNKYERTASFTMPGDTRLVAGVTVELSGWGPWDGKYIIKQAKHTVDSSGYVTKINLRWAIAAKKTVTTTTTTTTSTSTSSRSGPASGSGSAAAFVETARNEIGYKEKTGNNDNKYSEWAGNPNVSWCAYFVSWCAAHSGAPVPTTYGYVGSFTDHFKSKGLYKSASSGYIPKPGDIMIQTDRHIGIVESADSSAVHTIEGNTSNSVKRMTRSYGEITGFCTPWG